MSAAAARLPAQPPSDAAPTLFITETFGPTFQGEGPSLGRQAVFIRLSGCNLSCGQGQTARWACDTPHSWDFATYDPRDPRIRRKIEVEELVSWAVSLPPALVVITGGEPLIQQAGLEQLATALRAAGREIEVETNGTQVPSAELIAAVTTFNVSPKLTTAGGSAAKRIVSPALESFAACGKAAFKFVVTEPAECEEIADLVERFAMDDVWVMPEGMSAEAVRRGLRTLAEEVLTRGWNLSPRLHMELWEGARGR